MYAENQSHSWTSCYQEHKYGSHCHWCAWCRSKESEISGPRCPVTWITSQILPLNLPSGCIPQSYFFFFFMTLLHNFFGQAGFAQPILVAECKASLHISVVRSIFFPLRHSLTECIVNFYNRAANSWDYWRCWNFSHNHVRNRRWGGNSGIRSWTACSPYCWPLEAAVLLSDSCMLLPFSSFIMV